MHTGKLVLAQSMDQLARKTFGRIVERYGGDRRVRDFSCANFAAWLRAADLSREFAQHLIRVARRLYIDEPFRVDLKATVYALDSTTIDPCLTMFPWAPFRSTKLRCIDCLIESVEFVRKLTGHYWSQISINY